MTISFSKSKYVYNGTSLFLFFLFFSLSQSSSSQQLAFPSAKGAAAYVSGGRSGSVSVVTNLNDSGPGSLRSFASVSNTTIVFNVSGIIKLSNLLRFTGNNVTIAGQTAPEGGVSIEGRSVIFQNNENLIVRYLRFRNGYHNGDIDDSITSYGLIDVIFDHCSISFGGDEAIELVVDNSRDQGGAITVQNCFIAESKTGSIMGAQAANAPDVFGTLSMIGNVWYNITHRFPNIVGNARIDLINNYVHNVEWRLTRGNGGYTLNQLGNLYDFGKNTVWDVTLNHHGCDTRYGLPSIYANGNTIIGNQGNGGSQPVSNRIPDMNANNRLMWKYFYDGDAACGFGAKYEGDQLEPAFFSNTQHALLGLAPTIHQSTELKNTIVPTIGVSKRLNADGTVSDNTDVLDAKWKRNIMEGNYIPPMDQSKYTTPAIPSVTRPRGYDSDNDGMPDAWEMIMFNTLSHDGTKDSNGNGYTDLEDFLNQVDLHEAKNVEVERIDVSPSTARLQLKETLQLSSTYTPRNTTNKNGTWSSSNTAIATVNEKGLVTPVSIGDGPISVGDVEITYTAADGHTKGTSKINVFAPPVLVYAGDDQEICNGGSTTFTAKGASSYLWNTGARTASIFVSPSTSRTYTVTGYDSTGEFSDTDEVSIIVSSGLKVSAGSNVTIKLGESTTLKATGATTYKWSTGAIGASINVSPKTTTTYSVKGTKSGCGEATGNVTVTVLEASKVKASAGPDQTIYEGEGAILTATGGSSYLWNTGRTTARVEVAPTTSRTYTVTAFDSTGKNSDQAQVRVTVLPRPSKITASAGPDQTIYLGEGATLTATGGSTYLWNTGRTTARVEVAPTTSRTYTVTTFDSTGKNSDQAQVRVTVLPRPSKVTASAGPDQTIYEGEGAILTATGGSNYLWNTGRTTARVEVAPTTSRTYTVTAFDSTGKNSDQAQVRVTVLPRPSKVTASAGPDQTIYEGEGAILTATGGSSYLWNTGRTTARVEVAPTTSRTYTVTAFDSTGKNSDQAQVRVTVLPRPSKVTASAGPDQTIYEGEGAILTATGGSSYLWNTGRTAARVEVAPTTSRIYTVTAFDSTGKNSDQAQVRVTVVPRPSKVTASAGPDQTIYEGEGAILTATGGSSYLWNTGRTTARVEVAPTTSRTYTVTAFDSTGENSDQAQVRVTVAPRPSKVTASAGPDQTIYEGEGAILTATGGSSYLWNTGRTTARVEVAPTTSRTYTVTAFDSTGENSDQAQVRVTVLPRSGKVALGRGVEDRNMCNDLNISLTASHENTDNSLIVDKVISDFDDAQTVILEGQSITLTANGAYTYKWSNGATASHITVNPNITTTYTVTGSDDNCDSEKSITVSVYEKVTADAGNDVTICRNESTILTAKGSQSNEYLWSTGETTESITVSPKFDTEYSVMTYNDLDSDIDNVMVYVENCEKENAVLNSQNVAALDFSIHPNPTYGELHINISGLFNLAAIHLYDFSGKLLYNETIKRTDQITFYKTLDLSEYKSGIYLLQLVDGHKVITKKVILK